MLSLVLASALSLSDESNLLPEETFTPVASQNQNDTHPQPKKDLKLRKVKMASSLSKNAKAGPIFHSTGPDYRVFKSNRN